MTLGWAPLPGAQGTSILPSGTKSLAHVLSPLPVGLIQLLMARLSKHFLPCPCANPPPDLAWPLGPRALGLISGKPRSSAR